MQNKKNYLNRYSTGNALFELALLLLFISTSLLGLSKGYRLLLQQQLQSEQDWKNLQQMITLLETYPEHQQSNSKLQLKITHFRDHCVQLSVQEPHYGYILERWIC